MKYLSLFSGIGGFELGIQRAYEDLQNISDTEKFKHEAEDTEFKKGRVDSDRQTRLGNPVCIGYSEIDKYATAIYQKHFPEHKNYGDITKINERTLPDFDLLVGGFPCQSFSIAGKRGGFSDTRGTLFFEIARIAKEKRPRYLLLENVKGLLSHDDGKTFRTIICTLDELGYDLQWQVLNSKNFGVPQNRERVFIVGHFRGTSRPEVFPIGEGTEQTIKQVIGGRQTERVYGTEEIAPTINTAQGEQRQTKIGIRINRVDRKTQTYDLKESNTSGALTSTMWKGIDAVGRTGVKEGLRIRRLTPTECERLQGFPDGWTEGVSDTQRYKCLGNAVTVNVIEAIMLRLNKQNETTKH